eukprot:TRINITY_DN26719_c0_g1_i2.p1 TRINITY_DN26719_c0_g1~~TRINITY_DN26719_c0_g1_i2.p1  ORF type:complete len:941 (+),score=224.22 TRINITY_DN26719_c0_g1_i2:74-2824(+)
MADGRRPPALSDYEQRPSSSQSIRPRLGLRAPPKPLGALTSPPEELLSPTAVQRLGAESSTQSSPLPKVSSAPDLRRPLPVARTPGNRLHLDVPRPGTSGSSRKGVVDKKLASRFKVKDEPFQVPEPSTPGRAPWAVPIDHGLAMSTRFENFKKEQYTIQIEEVNGSPESGAGASAEAIAAAAAEAEVMGMIDKEAFVHDVSQINHSIEDLSRSIRLEHLEKNSAEEKQNAAREEARRRKEAESRRNRKKEQMARDPKRKVALRIENRRREDDLIARKESKKGGSAKKTKQDIPFAKFEVHGPNGSSKVAIVDVLKIKQKCEFMDMPVSVVAEMIEIREKEERRSKLMNSTMSTNISSTLFQSVQSSLTTPYHSMSELSVDERLDRASILRSETYAQTMLHKVSSMRNQWRYTVPYDLDVADRNTPRGSSRLVVTKTHSSNKKDGKLAEELDKAVESEDKRKVRRSSISSLAVLKQLSAPQSFTNAKQASMAKMVRKRSQMEAEELAHYEALKARARRHWSVVRALVKWCMLFFTTQKKNESAEMMKVLLKSCGEFLRIREAVRKFIGAVKVLQRHIKAFLVLKRKRCLQIEKEWMRFEEHHLNVWFRYQAQAIVREQKAQAAEAQGASAARKMRSKRALLQLMEAGIKEGDDLVAVSGCTIPAKERRAVIQRFHNGKLRKHVYESALSDDVVKEALQAQRDLCAFLRTMGSDARPEVPEHLPQIDAHWYVLDEDTALGLIARCAQALAHVSGFQEHPANLAIPENRRTIYLEYVVGNDPAAFAARIMRSMDRVAFRGRFGRPPAMRTEDIIDEEQQLVGINPSKRDIIVAKGLAQEGQVSRSQAGSKDTPAGSDVEQVFKNFTPRLREISEVQVQEYNESKRTEEAGGSDPALQALKDLQTSDLLLSSSAKKEER